MKNQFELISEYKPSGDQPEAIRELVSGLKKIKNFKYCWELQELEKHLQFRM